MFSCALFHSDSYRTPVQAQSSKVDVEMFGLVGQGKASCSYRLDQDYRGLLFYVPSLLAFRPATRQHVRLSRCQLSVSQGPRGNTTTQLLHLAKLDAGITDNTSLSVGPAPLPNYLELRRHYKVAATKLCGAHSHEDVLLHVGNLPKGSRLTVCFDFLTRVSSSNQSARAQYCFQNIIPAAHSSYSLLLAAMSPVQNVTCTTPVETLQNFSWTHLHEGEQHRNLVQVAYETKCRANRGPDWDTENYSGFTVQLGGEVSAGCCSSLFPSSHFPSSPGTLYDGVMMMSNIFQPHQLPSSVKQEPLNPSEFVFVVDCSGSMCGTNIQIAANTLITCIKSLPMGSHFNIVAFGSRFRKLFHSSQVYQPSSMEAAVQFANQLQASLGGTDLLGPLRWIFKTQRSRGVPCQVFVITDGGVTNTTSVLRCVRKNRHQAR